MGEWVIGTPIGDLRDYHRDPFPPFPTKNQGAVGVWSSWLGAPGGNVGALRIDMGFGGSCYHTTLKKGSRKDSCYSRTI